MILGPPEPKLSSLLLLGAGPGGGAPYEPAAPDNLALPEITGTASVGHTLTLASPGAWNHAPSSFTYQWYRQPGATGPFEEIAGDDSFEMTLTEEDMGAIVRCEVVATNAVGDSEPVASNGLGPIAAGDAPANSETPIVTGSAVQGEELTCSEGTWDFEVTSFEYQWQRDEGDGFEDIASTSNTHECTGGDVGFLLRCVVTASNAFGSNSAASNNVGPIAAGSAPANTGAPGISGSGVLGGELTCSEGTWDHVVMSFDYQWQRDEGEGFDDIANTTSTHVCSMDDVGFMLRCVVTASNEFGGTPAPSDGMGPIAAGYAPSNTEPPVISGTPSVGEVLTCSDGAWEGAASFEYQWQRDQGSGFEDIPNTTNTHLCDAEDADYLLRCVVYGINEFGENSAASNSAGPIEGEGLSNDTSLSVFTINGVAPMDNIFNLPYFNAGLLLSELMVECMPTHPMATLGEMATNPNPLEQGTDSELTFVVTAEDGDTYQEYLFYLHVMSEGTAEVTDVTAAADVGGALHGTYFFMHRAGDTAAVLLDASRPPTWYCSFGSGADGTAFNTSNSGRWIRLYLAPSTDIVFWGNTGGEWSPPESATSYVEVSVNSGWDHATVCSAFQSAIAGAGFNVVDMGGGAFLATPPNVGALTAPSQDSGLWDVFLSVQIEGREHVPEVEGYANIAVPIYDNCPASDVALAMATACNGNGWTVSASGDVATFVDNEHADRTDASDGGTPTGFTISVIQQGAGPA